MGQLGCLEGGGHYHHGKGYCSLHGLLLPPGPRASIVPHPIYIHTLPRSLVLHIVIAHYKEKVDLVEGLIGEILDNPAMGAMQSHVFVMSKAEDQVRIRCKRQVSLLQLLDPTSIGRIKCT